VGFFDGKARKPDVFDEVLRVLVMLRRCNVKADVVQQRRVFQQLSLGVFQPVQRPEPTKQIERQPRDVLRMRLTRLTVSL